MAKGTVGVIGAGAAGLCAAKFMKDAGYEVTLYEIGSVVGGMWVYENDNGLSSAYKTLYINTAKPVTNFQHFPFPPEVPPFPSHWDMARYLKSYSDYFGITPRIRFKTRVTDVRPAADYTHQRPRWSVKTEAGETMTFDIVIPATGHLSVPMEAPELKDTFKGQYLHSHYYREPLPFVGKRVCIVGVGNSALDIASDLATTAERTVLVARSTPVIVPKLVFGRAFSDTVMPLYSNWVPGFVRRGIIKGLIFLIHGRMTDLGFAPSTKKVHTTSNAQIVGHIRYHRVIVKQGIDRIAGKQITFKDGKTEEFDVLIAATGYILELPFMAKEVIEVRNNALDLYMRMVPPNWRGLYFIGFSNQDTALNWVAEHQMRWVVAHATGEAALPPVAEMEAEIAARKARIARDFKDTPRHGIEIEHLPYFTDLKRTLKAARRRAAASAPAKAEAAE